MREKKIWTHVSTKALQGMQRFFGESDTHEMFLWPTPYKRSDGRDGWTVVTRRK